MARRRSRNFKVGDPITSRNEFEPGGEIEIKHVEEVFRRSAPILHLHVGGQVIRTTGEHPFFAYNKGWVKASTLVIGDRLLCADGQWVAVDDMLDTGEWEVVYNLRIADFHTYFVTDWNWGFSVWSHNTGGACDGPPSGNLTTATLNTLQQRLEGTSNVARRTIVLQGNADYTILGSSAHYFTNADGQLSRVTFNLTPQTDNGPSGNTTWMGQLGQSGDQGGHILGKQFNGSNRYPNLVPMNGNLNAYPVPQNGWNGGGLYW